MKLFVILPEFRQFKDTFLYIVKARKIHHVVVLSSENSSHEQYTCLLMYLTANLHNFHFKNTYFFHSKQHQTFYSQSKYQYWHLAFVSQRPFFLSIAAVLQYWIIVSSYAAKKTKKKRKTWPSIMSIVKLQSTSQEVTTTEGSNAFKSLPNLSILFFCFCSLMYVNKLNMSESTKGRGLVSLYSIYFYLLTTKSIASWIQVCLHYHHHLFTYYFTTEVAFDRTLICSKIGSYCVIVKHLSLDLK